MRDNVLLIIAVFLEATITTLPLTLSLLIILYIFKKDHIVFFLAFVSGILLDLLLLRSIGMTSIFLVVFLFVIFLYERKFEVETVPFIFFASFLGGAFYLWLFGYTSIVLQSTITALISSAFFLIIKKFIPRHISNSPLTPLV